MGRLEKIADWTSFAGEVLRHRPLHAPGILAKALNAWAVGGHGPKKTIVSGLWMQPTSAARDYVAYWGEGQLHQALRLVNWQGAGRRLVEDKLVMAERHLEAGVATAPIIAVVGRDEALHPHQDHFRILHNRDAVVDALAAAPGELIVKPAGGSRGGEVRSLKRTDAGWLFSDALLDAASLADHLLQAAPPEGTLIQRRLNSHRDLEPVGGALGLCTARITTALLHSGPIVLFQFYKLMGRPGVIDNFAGGSNGNLLVDIDRATGKIRRAYGRPGGQRYLLSEMKRHPATGAPLPGFTIPLWQDAVDLALRASAACPETPLVGADVAITDHGPVMIEINAAWDADYAELTEGCGLRVLLRRIWPDLLLEEDVKKRAQLMLGL